MVACSYSTTVSLIKGILLYYFWTFTSFTSEQPVILFKSLIRFIHRDLTSFFKLIGLFLSFPTVRYVTKLLHSSGLFNCSFVHRVTNDNHKNPSKQETYSLTYSLFSFSYSLENFSDKIRWSLDLRWQNPAKDNGFHGIKDCILMRTARDPNYVPDWSDMAGIDRTQKQMEAVVRFLYLTRPC